MTMSRLQESARIYSIGFSLGILSADEIEAWADLRISESDIPSDDLVSLCQATKISRLDVAHHLREVASDHPLSRECDIILGFLSEKLKAGSMSPAEVAKAMDQCGEYRDDRHWPDLLENAKMEGDCNALVEEMRRFLTPFERIAVDWQRKVQQADAANP